MGISIAFAMCDWPISLRLVYWCGPWLIALSGLAIHIHIACGKGFEVALKALASSVWLAQQREVWGVSRLRSRFLLLSMVAGLLTWPGKGIHIRKGELDEAEVRQFPAGLRKKILLGDRLIIVGSLLIVAGVALHR